MCFFTIIYLIKIFMYVNVLNLKLFYVFVKFSECQIYMIKNEYFNCDQKKYIQKNYLISLFEKIYFLLNSEINWFMNSVSQINIKINMKLFASFIAKIMKFIMKSAAKFVMNMNMHINLNKNTWTVFMKKIYIMLSIMF